MGRMESGLLHLDAQASDLVKAVAWCGILLAGGVAAWRLTEQRARARIPWGLCMGLGAALAAMTGTVGLAIGLGAPALALFSFGAILVMAAALRSRRGTRLLPRVPISWTPDRVIGVALYVAAALGLLLMVPLLARPHVSYDILSYHLSIAHSFRAGEWGFIDGNVYSRMPGGAFVLYGPVLSDPTSTLDDPGVRVLLWAVIAAGALLCAEIAGQLGGRWSARGLAAALFVWHPIVWGGLANAHNDLLVTMYALGAVSCLLRAKDPRTSAVWLVLAGLLGGSAVAVKFSALGIVAVPLAAGTVLMIRGNGGARGRALLWLALGGAIAFGPWMARAWWFGGHPLHPFMGTADGWSADQSAFITGHHEPITLFDARYWTSALTRLTHFGYGVPPLASLVALGLAVGLFAWWKRPRIAIVAIMAWLGYAALLTVRLSPDRFAMPAVALGCVTLAVVATIAWQRPIRRHGMTALVCVLAFLSAPWALAWMYLDPDIFDRNSTMPEEILITAHEEIGDGRALLLFEARGRWFFGESGRMPLMNTTWDVPPWADGLRQSHDGEDFSRWLRDRGVTVVVVNEFELGRLVDFYGGLKRGRMMGNVGVEGDHDQMMTALTHYKPFEFASFTAPELERLLEFLEWSRLRASQVVPAGEVARIWVTPLGDLPPANGEPDGNS
jgi:hypothetical protein